MIEKLQNIRVQNLKFSVSIRKLAVREIKKGLSGGRQIKTQQNGGTGSLKKDRFEEGTLLVVRL